MGLHKVTLAMANRSGGKTYCFAILSLLDTLANDNCESANLGAIQAQAQRCYRYMQRFINQSPAFTGKVKGESTIGRTNFINGSSIEVLIATLSGVNSPHPQKLKMDEIELIPWNVLQEAFSMVQSKNDVKGTTVLGSTRKFAIGPMQRLIDEKAGKGIKLFSWCIWEVMQAFPTDNPELVERIKNTFGADLPKNFQDFGGYYDWEDVMEKYENLDRDVWNTQWTCQQPDLSGLIYAAFDEVENTDLDFTFDKVSKQIYLFEDYGASRDHPDVILFASVDPFKQSVTIFDEIYIYSNIGTDQILKQVNDKFLQYDMDLNDVHGWIGDPHGLTETMDRMNRGLPIMPPVKDEDVASIEGARASQIYLVKNGISSVRKFIATRRLKITPNCTQLKQELMSYAFRKLQNGKYSDEPAKDLDHGPDAMRYGLIRLFPQLAYGSFDETTSVPQDQQIIQSNDKLEAYNYGSGLTSGLYNKTL